MKMKHGLKKLLAFVLALSMVLSTGLTAFAENTNDEEVISTISVKNLPQLTVGDTAPTIEEFASGIQLGSEHYTIDTEDTLVSYWYDLTAEEWSNDSFVFEDKHEYQLILKAVPEEGYQFAEEVDLTLEDELVGQYPRWDDGSVTFFIYYSFLEQIQNVEVTVPTKEVGTTFSMEAVKLPENANYKINADLSGWVELTEDGETEVTTGTFQSGHIYELQLEIEPKDGCEFVEDISPVINNGNMEADYAYIGQDGGSIGIRYEFSEELSDETIELTVDKPEVGKTVGSLNVKIPENEKYKIDFISWDDVTDSTNSWYELQEEDVFQDGHKYCLNVQISPKIGYKFKQDITLNVNGEEAENYYSDPSYVYVSEYYTFRDVIEEVKVDGVPAAEIGKAVTFETIKVPEGANYEVKSVEWYDMTDGVALEEGDVFQNGHKYDLSICISPKAGYEFSEDTTLWFNGTQEKLYDDYWLNDTELSIYKTYSFLEKIHTVEILEALPEAVAGQEIQEVVLKVPEDAKYTANGFWNGETGTFQKGNAYILYINLTPEKGYEFSDDVVVTVAGKPLDTVHFYNGNDYIEIHKVHDLGDNTIDVIEITIPELKTGEKITGNGIKAVADEKYEFLRVGWYDAETGKPVIGDTFEKGKKYELSLGIASLENYVFSNNVQIKVNGKLIDIKALSDDAYFSPQNVWFSLIFDLTEKATTPTSPATGDSTTYAVWVALAAVSLAGITVATSKKRRYNK